jgi:hypothetical protein
MKYILIVKMDCEVDTYICNSLEEAHKNLDLYNGCENSYTIIKGEIVENHKH